jgi:hypothetical protein
MRPNICLLLPLSSFFASELLLQLSCSTLSSS